MEIVASLTPSLMDELEKKHHIRSAGEEPWRKSLTAGTDDHAGLFIGTVYTALDAAGVAEAPGAIFAMGRWRSPAKAAITGSSLCRYIK